MPRSTPPLATAEHGSAAGDTPCTPGRANWQNCARVDAVMESLHCHVNNLSRRKANGGERSAVAAAAYISGSALWNAREDRETNFENRRDVIYSDILVPPGSPDWARNRERLWNLVDATAKRKDARLAKTIEAALPRDIPLGQRVTLVREFVAPYVASGMVADIAIHDDGTNHNPHVHVLLTVRSLKPDGFSNKIPNVDHKSFVTAARTGWETICNKYLEAAGSSVRLDGRSFKTRGIQQQPTKHRGPDRAERRAKRARVRHLQQQEHSAMSRATPNEIRLYPHLTERDDWPPEREAQPANLSAEEQKEWNAYWEEKKEEAEQAAMEKIQSPEYQAWTKEQDIEEPETKLVDMPWYMQAKEKALEQDTRVEVDPSTDRWVGRELNQIGYERSQREQQEQAAYAADVSQRARALYRTKNEHQLLESVKTEPKEVRRAVEDHILAEREHYIRAQDLAERQAEIEKHLSPVVHRDFEKTVEGWRMAGDRAQQEPGPNREPHSPADLRTARERMIDEMEQDRDEER